MTISSANRKAGPYVGNSVTTVFAFSFKVFAAADLLVVKINNATNVETTLALTTDYTVSLNANQNASPGGSITLTSAPATGYNMVITSQVEYLQETDFTNQGGFYPEVVTKALDKLTILTQQLEEQVSRAVKVSVVSSSTADELVADIFAVDVSAAASAAAASNSATAASNSATAASNSATAASNSATAAAGYVVPSQTGHSGALITNGSAVSWLDSQFSHRNRIINGNFSVNQRGYVSGAAVGSGLYGHDRWKQAASGDTYTFSTTANKTTVTIPSGKVLRQVVEGLSLQSGTYVLSWEGTAQGKIGGGSYGATGITASITGGTDTTIEFGPGTVANVQLEIGSVPTPFESRSYGFELSLCQRYYQFIQPGQVLGMANTGYLIGLPVTYSMRAAPNASIVGTWSVNGVGQPTVYGTPTATGCLLAATVSSAGGSCYFIAGSTSGLALSAEL